MSYLPPRFRTLLGFFGSAAASDRTRLPAVRAGVAALRSVRAHELDAAQHHSRDVGGRGDRRKWQLRVGQERGRTNAARMPSLSKYDSCRVSSMASASSLKSPSFTSASASSRYKASRSLGDDELSAGIKNFLGALLAAASGGIERGRRLHRTPFHSCGNGLKVANRGEMISEPACSRTMSGASM